MENHLGANIKLFRKNKGYTQEELAGMLGVTPQAVSRWESEAGLPDVSMIVPIAQTLGITTDALLGYQHWMWPTRRRVRCGLASTSRTKWERIP